MKRAVLPIMLWLCLGSWHYPPADAQPEPALKKERNRYHRPTICAPYYNDGTDRWKDCMGVGYIKPDTSE